MGERGQQCCRQARRLCMGNREVDGRVVGIRDGLASSIATQLRVRTLASRLPLQADAEAFEAVRLARQGRVT